MTPNFTQTAAFLWSVADLLRGDFKQSQYGPQYSFDLMATVFTPTSSGNVLRSGYVPHVAL